MDNLDDSEINVKISDSAYSNSCSNSQSRRSHSSKSTRSGSSGSSGYGGKPSTSGSSNKLEQTSKKDKDAKKRKLSHADVKELPEVLECMPPEPVTYSDVPKEEIHNAIVVPTPPLSLQEKAAENVDISTTGLTVHSHEMQTGVLPTATVSLDTGCEVADGESTGFSCAVSMHDGVVMYTTQSLTANLGFPRDMWIGRSFIDFIHPKDRTTFLSEIINGLAVPTIVMGTLKSGDAAGFTKCGMACRIRHYRTLKSGFGIMDNVVSYMPFLLKYSFKDIHDDNGKVVYLIIQATPIYSGYRTSKECVVNATPFVIKHSAAGLLEYIDVESISYLGYLPQDIYNNDALLLYHPDDLPYLKSIYESIVKEGSVAKSMPYRMLANNGDYVKLETEWSSFINPWSMKLEFVIGKHYVIEGPTKPNVFLSPPTVSQEEISQADILQIQAANNDRDLILKALREVLTKPAEKAKQQMSKRCHDITQIMESLLEEQPKQEEELRIDIPEPESNAYERDSVMLGGISPHHDSDSKSSTGTPLSYNQLNYTENLQRYFDSHRNLCFEENAPSSTEEESTSKISVEDNSTILPSVNPIDFKGMESGPSNHRICPPTCIISCQTLRLTETLLNKHNNDMEKELAKSHRETRGVKGDRTFDSRQKKKEHLERCNAIYQPTMAGAVLEGTQHGVKRARSNADECSNKQQCKVSRQMQRQDMSVDFDQTYPSTSAGVPPAFYTPNTIMANPVMSQAANPSLMNPAFYQMIPGSASRPWINPSHVYSCPYIFAESNESAHDITPPVAHRQCVNHVELPSNNFKQITESFTGPLKHGKYVPSTHSGLNSDETIDKTDGESSYSSFYSSFFKTDSSCGTDSSAKKDLKKGSLVTGSWHRGSSADGKKVAPQKKANPQWMDQATSEVLYKYQIKTQSKKSVLEADLEKIKKFEQPALVNEQLGQLYSELQLEGVAARLTLEEGITTSSSSGDETSFNFPKPKAVRRKREYNKLSMIYEENAPMPPPPEVAVDAVKSESTQS